MSVANTKEYGEGYAAFEEGRDTHANPYASLSSQGKRWSAGYYDAKSDQEDEDGLVREGAVEPPQFDNEIITLAVEASSL
jgi:ribosome modulation factor